ADKHMYDFSVAREQYDKEIQRAFFNATLRCNSLSDIHYEQFFATLGWYYKDGFGIVDIPENKMKILIDNNVIRMSGKNLTFIRESYPHNLIYYIVAYIEEYCDLVMAPELFDSDEAVKLLGETISDEFKLKLLENIEGELTAINPAYTDTVKEYILINNFAEEDLRHFVSHYGNEGTKTKAAIISKVLGWAGTPSKEALPISRELFENVISSDRSMTAENVVTLFSYLLPKLDEAQCKRYLIQLRLNSFLGLFKQKRPRIIISDTNTRILETFRHNGWITKFEVDEKDENYYRAYGRRAHLGSDKDAIVLL
ncbi:MAG: hypothetical protein VB099_19510, partial [Candidatus Limiplasma sp.]|nr:hypothetical protein [Candidatus Limiplasma sp.]